ncbi:pyridoxamine 5'-phosphate oxidase family protein [Suipraeoptans intestinalis]|uniref:pyridoxamine 5'-phosphate oxidase family protein n=1 Tax=Suipraeoptans intestinalis TaxID=2606628 RepID=UPI0023EFE9C5|nr:pyridoxamine 5'-phosphate oxidase family protein [Suipraeoptans intestinalis]MDD7769953.1 pyridoxamine 5'-phosphate oxidase family protein [Suipraeoptans intestinalis]MDY3121714.1 pyridoxamine 5'-phosphate oxidase family protein [Suipraeoptans intestinalis]
MRRKDREVTDTQEILRIVDKAQILHLGLLDGKFPYIVPLHYGYEYEKEKHNLIFYMHGSREGRKLDLIQMNPNACVELECDIELVSGGDNPCTYGSTYASVIGKGYAEIIEDPYEKMKGLQLLMENQTGRKFEISEKMASSVSVIKVSLAEFTAKSRPK